MSVIFTVSVVRPHRAFESVGVSKDVLVVTPENSRETAQPIPGLSKERVRERKRGPCTRRQSVAFMTEGGKQIWVQEE